MDPSPALALVFAVASGAGPGVGSEIRAGREVPPAVLGLLIPGRGVIELAPSTRAALGSAPGQLRLERGRVRLVAQGTLEVISSGLEVTVGSGVALVAASEARVTICADGASVVVRRSGSVPPEAAAQGAAGLGSSPIDVDLELARGRCVDLAPGGGSDERALDDAALGELLVLAEGQPPPAFALPDLIADPEGDLDDIEARHAETLERGARQEGAACGCQEDAGGGSGSLDTGGSGVPTPDPEPTDPGRIRVRVRVPRLR